MLISEQRQQFDTQPALATTPGVPCAELAELLHQAFGTSFALFDGGSGEVLYEPAGQPMLVGVLGAELCREVARRARPEFLDDDDPLLVLAIPVEVEGTTWVAVAGFLTGPVSDGDDLLRVAEAMKMDPAKVMVWAEDCPAWSPQALLRVAELAMVQWQARGRIRHLEQESETLSQNLSNTYEEISLLHRLTQNLRLSKRDEDLCQETLRWLQEVLPAQGLAVQLLPAAQDRRQLDRIARTQPRLLFGGNCPVDQAEFAALVEHVGPRAIHRPAVINRAITEHEDWPLPQVRQAIVVAMAEGENVFGWLAALNHVKDAEFGSVEASLLASVAAILGIHSGNIDLYRQQSELTEGIIRALTSAIDAKDPYTCGHSDRVARLAVRLGREMGCDETTLHTIYWAGLLHDIGKIGVDDSVLRKPGKLSDAEFEHIKRHTEIGHRILGDIPKLGDVLPVVLHHHESWDGRGYPRQLGAEGIPLAARIVAVADSYDAMSSNRPYRNGMPEEKIDKIFCAGSGQQWDPQIVAAFFRARAELQQIAHSEHDAAGAVLPEPA